MKKVFDLFLVAFFAKLVWSQTPDLAGVLEPADHIPAINPGNPEAWKDLKKFFLNVINKYKATIIEKKVCLQKRICHRLAPSKDFTIIPPKLKHSAPSKTKTVPGTLFNIVNLSL